MPRQKDIYLGRHKKDWAAYEQSAERVKEPHKHDVLCGRGGRVNVWPGNVAYRRVVEHNKDKCRSLSNPHKRLLARSIVDAVAQQDPPGRFLQRTKDKKDWLNIGYNPAVHKTGQALREKNKDESENESDGGESDEERQVEAAVAAKAGRKRNPTLPPIDLHRDLSGTTGSPASNLPQHLKPAEAHIGHAMAASPMMAASLAHHQQVMMNHNHPSMLPHFHAAQLSHLNSSHPSPPNGAPPTQTLESQQLAQVVAAASMNAPQNGNARQAQQANEQHNNLSQVLAAINGSGQPLDAASFRALSAIAMFSPQGFSASAAQAALAAGAGGAINVPGGGSDSFVSRRRDVGPSSGQQQQHFSQAPTTAFDTTLRRAVSETTGARHTLVSNQSPAPFATNASLRRMVSEVVPGGGAAPSQFALGQHFVGPPAAMSGSVQPAQQPAQQPDSMPTLPPRKRRDHMIMELSDRQQQQDQAAAFRSRKHLRPPTEEEPDAEIDAVPRQQVNAKMLRVAGQLRQFADSGTIMPNGNSNGTGNHSVDHSAAMSLGRRPSSELSIQTNNRTLPTRRSSALAAISARGRKRSSAQGPAATTNKEAAISRLDLKPPPPTAPSPTTQQFGRQTRYELPQEREAKQQYPVDELSDISDNDELSKQAESLMCLPDVEGVHDFESLSDCNSMLDIDEARRNGLLTKLYPSDDDEDENADANSAASGRRYVEVMNAYCGIPLIDSEEEDVTANLEVHAGVPLDSPCSSPPPMFGDGNLPVVGTTPPGLQVAFGAGMLQVGGGLRATMAREIYCRPQ